MDTAKLKELHDRFRLMEVPAKAKQAGLTPFTYQDSWRLSGLIAELIEALMETQQK